MRILCDDALPLDSPPDDIFAPFAAGTTAQPFVVAQLGQSLDGRIATLTGDSKYINGAAALDHLHRIRAQVDAVLVGIGTVLADDPLLTVRRVPGRNPHRIVIDPRGRLPPDARCLNADSAGCLVVCGEEAAPPAGAEALRLPRAGNSFDIDGLLDALGARGFHRILVEGGARTISAFIDAGRVDRLHVLVAPVILGSGKPGLELNPIKRLDEALRPATKAYLLEGGEVLFDCALRPRSPTLAAQALEDAAS